MPDDLDDVTVDALRRALGDDRVPSALVDMAKASFTWRTIDAELATLGFDSAIDELAGVRGGATVRALTFETGGADTRTIDLEVAAGDAGAFDISGLVSPATVGSVVVEHATGERHDGLIDERGRFELVGVASGLARVRVALAGGARTVTEWVSLR